MPVLRELSVAEQRYLAVLAVIEDGVPVTASTPAAHLRPADAARTVDVTLQMAKGDGHDSTGRCSYTLA
jgi:hypothetical protein